MSEVYASSCVKDCRPTICRTSGLTWPSGMYVAMVPRSECCPKTSSHLSQQWAPAKVTRIAGRQH